MYNTRLNEFSDKQLDTLIEWADEKLNIIQIAQMEAELMDDREMYDIIQRCEEDLETFTLFKVQAMNAKADLKQIETTHQ